MPKSQAQTDAEILAGAKTADVITSEGSSTIRVRHTRSVHPVQCRCALHIQTRFHNYSSKEEQQKKTDLDWYQGE